jgi:hypothetical protein
VETGTSNADADGADGVQLVIRHHIPLDLKPT